jgi:DNA modification methylase
MKRNEIYLGDCLELMPKHIEDKSIDMIFCDLPYGTTQNKWDSVIDLDKLWKEYKRVIKDRGAIVLFSQTPFDKVLGASNLNMLKYEWIWDKFRATGNLNAKKMPMKKHENILVFYKKAPTYNPQGLIKLDTPRTEKLRNSNSSNYGVRDRDWVQEYTNYPKSILSVKEEHNVGRPHPTQKPLSLIEYMIKTYTNEGDLILDNTCGSGTTGLGAKNLNRDYIMMEQDPEYYEIACKRVLT